MELDNHHGICIFKPSSECENCPLKDKLKCHFDIKEQLLQFGVPFVVFSILSILGMLLGGYGLYVLGWIGFIIIFLYIPGWEIRILCSHCPYYAENSKILHCPINYGSPKIWRYHPEPMSRLEKIQFISGLIVFFGYPALFLFLGRQYILMFFAAISLITLFWILQKYSCSRCVNLSCPLNRVPEKIAIEFLNRNPIMKNIWKRNDKEV